MKTFADKVIAFNKQLDFSGSLPKGISIMNPFKENENALSLSTEFYKKYYNDQNARQLILGINPGRFGAGITGIPFTDPKRAVEKCGLLFKGESKHEPSSVFIYEVIDAFGGAASFYNRFYINSVCPLGFTATTEKGSVVNYNYYDSKELLTAMHDFIINNIEQQISLGVNTDLVFCFGTGKNETFLRKLNAEKKFFRKIISLEHPRYIMQYQSKNKQVYINNYISAFRQNAFSDFQE
jgi:Domain of unknown function (DUF4918)